MAKKRKRFWIPIIVVLFVLYIFFAAQPVQLETVLESQWITSIGSAGTESNAADVKGIITPFELGGRFGYVDESGNVILSKSREGYLSLSDSRFAEYEGMPSEIEVMSPFNEPFFSVPNPEGYPLFGDDRNFIIGKDQNSISYVDDQGTVVWTYDFDAPITCADAESGLFLAGLLNGTVVLLNRSGNAVFSFDAFGSRISIICACTISDDGNRLAVVSGIDQQRFLLFEQYAGSYRVTYHEYIGEGYRRAVHLSFIDNGRRAAYEREGGMGIYDVETRKSTFIPLDGSVYAIDDKGTDDVFFVITSLPNNGKNLVSIRYPGIVTGKSPFMTDSAFIARSDSSLLVGGGGALLSFALGKR